jgi:hypothetical protein
MLSAVRHLARPLSLVALLALIAPSWAECRPRGGAAPDDGMSCCMKTGGGQGTVDSGCCAVRRAPESQQAPATKVTVRTAPAPLDLAADHAMVGAIPAFTGGFHSPALECGSPGLPLYLRLSVIRR